MIVELEGLEVFGRHGVEEDERREGRVFLYDVWLEVSEAGRSDRLEDVVDYREVAACVREVAGSSQFRLLEALAGAVADVLIHRFDAERATVRVSKPAVRPGGLEGTAAVRVSRP